MGQKTYKNISTRTQLGIEPGQEGQRDILPEKEARLVERGAIEVVGETDTPSGETEVQEVKEGQEKKTPEQIEAEQKAAEAAQKAEAERQPGRRGR